MPIFRPALFDFLRELSQHNDREWFAANKPRFEQEVKAPLLAFVEAFAPRLARIDPQASCDARSVFRIYRDTRFSKDKRPYKEHAAAQFIRGDHGGRGPSAAGYYLHLQPDDCFFVGGTWMPEPKVAARIRTAIAARPQDWVAARDQAGGLYPGESLVRVPRGIDPDHPLALDLRRKSFTAWSRFADEAVLAEDFVDRVAAAAARIAPMVSFLDEAGR